MILSDDVSHLEMAHPHAGHRLSKGLHRDLDEGQMPMVAHKITSGLHKRLMHIRRNAGVRVTEYLQNLESRVLIFIEGKPSVHVEELYAALVGDDPSLTKVELVDLVRQLANHGEVILEDEPPRVNSFLEYLKHWERNLSLLGSMAISFAAILGAYTLSSDSPVVVIRWVFGTMFVLFIPGYVAIQALFPRTADLTSIERFVLGAILSLGLVPSVALVLNYTPWGIKFIPVLISLTLITAGCVFIALIRQYNLCKYPARYLHL